MYLNHMHARCIFNAKPLSLTQKVKNVLGWQAVTNSWLSLLNRGLREEGESGGVKGEWGEGGKEGRREESWGGEGDHEESVFNCVVGQRFR